MDKVTLIGLGFSKKLLEGRLLNTPENKLKMFPENSGLDYQRTEKVSFPYFFTGLRIANILLVILTHQTGVNQMFA